MSRKIALTAAPSRTPLSSAAAWYPAASLIGLAKFSMQRCGYRAEGGRVDPVARPLELDAPKAARHLVHLEENHHRHRAEGLAVQNDIGVAVAKVQCPGQPDRIGAKLAGQFIRRFSPVGLAQYFFYPIRRKCRRRQGNDRHSDCNPGETHDRGTQSETK